jgi:hypothetical protein
VPPDHAGLHEAVGTQRVVAFDSVHARSLRSLRGATGPVGPGGRGALAGPAGRTLAHSTLTAGGRSDNPPSCPAPWEATQLTPGGRGLCSAARRSYRACRS